MDEAMLVQLFTSAGEPPVETKVMRDKFTNQASGYGFAVFASTEQAQRVLTNLNGQTAPGTQYTFRLNWSSFKPSHDRQRGPMGRGQRGPGGMMGGYPAPGYGGGMGMGGYGGGMPGHYGAGGMGGGGMGNKNTENTLFVGDLDVSVSEDILRNSIASAFPSVQIAHARIVSDQATGQSKGYGFVRFNSEADMQTVYAGSGQQLIIAGKPARIKPAMHRPKQSGPMHGGYNAGAPMYHPAPYGQPPMHPGMGMPAAPYAQPPMYPGYGAYPAAPAAYGAPYANYYGAPAPGAGRGYKP
eukprot:TRINITY_DN1552_c0_g5_i1.p1 TRINITY_DN1552_c0_g5~~TRINITY_DN1552_c0_g5_i1.p1  ORF type:complete len:339 (-),score=78.45 TRINITY_DN1552_c0_g5_i1:1110-2003(-)